MSERSERIKGTGLCSCPNGRENESEGECA